MVPGQYSHSHRDTIRVRLDFPDGYRNGTVLYPSFRGRRRQRGQQRDQRREIALRHAH